MIDKVALTRCLAGFTVFYGLERLARRQGPDSRGSGGSPGVYWLHLGSFLVYNGLITYTMALRVRTCLLFAVLFTVAMGLHFVLTNRGDFELETVTPTAPATRIRSTSWNRAAPAPELPTRGKFSPRPEPPGHAMASALKRGSRDRRTVVRWCGCGYFRLSAASMAASSTLSPACLA